MVENKPNLLKTYIYDRNIMTTTGRKKQLHREMEELNHRLSYVQKILEFKESHIINWQNAKVKNDHKWEFHMQKEKRKKKEERRKKKSIL